MVYRVHKFQDHGVVCRETDQGCLKQADELQHCIRTLKQDSP